MLYDTKVSSIVLRHGLEIITLKKQEKLPNNIPAPLFISTKGDELLFVCRKEEGDLSLVSVHGTGVGKIQEELTDFLIENKVDILFCASSDSTYSIVTDRYSSFLARKSLEKKYF